MWDLNSHNFFFKCESLHIDSSPSKLDILSLKRESLHVNISFPSRKPDFYTTVRSFERDHWRDITPIRHESNQHT